MSNAACYTCDVFEQYQAHAGTELLDLVTVIKGPLIWLVIAIAGLWIVWVGFQVIIGSLDWANALKQAFFLAFGLAVFQGVTGGLIEEVFDAAVGILGSLCGAIMGNAGGATGITALMTAVENNLNGIFSLVSAFFGGSGWDVIGAITNAVFGIVLLIPYLLLLILFLAHTAVALFRITLICGISPFIIALGAFPFGRNLIGAGVRTIIGSIVTMVAITTVFSIIIGSVDQLQVLEKQNDLGPSDFATLTSGPYLLALILGWLGVALVSEAVNIAGQISQSVLGSVSAGVISGGSMRGASMATGAARSASGLAGAALGGARERISAGMAANPHFNGGQSKRSPASIYTDAPKNAS